MNSSDCFNGSNNLLKNWKNLRSNLTSEKTDFEHLQQVTEFWSHTPLSCRILDWDDPSAWLDAWNLMYSNRFDESAVSLGMFYTLLLSGDNRWNQSRLKLMLLNDRKRHIQQIILEVDACWLLNLDYNKIVDANTIKKSYDIQQTYAYDGKKHSSVEKK